MHVLLSAFGSYGDVLPMVGLGATLRSRGHRVQMVCNPYFQAIIEAAGLELLPLGSADEYRSLMRHGDLWHPRRGLKLIMSTAARFVRPTYAIVESHYRHGETALVAHSLDFASRIFHDKCGAPLATVHFAPMALLSLDEPPRFFGVPDMTAWPRWSKAAVLWLGDRWIVDPAVAPALNAFRAEHSLPRVERVFSRWLNSPQLVLGLFPDWFGNPQADWPPQVETVGFPLWNPTAAHEHEMGEEVHEFLAAGEPPIVFAPGSANVQAEEFFRTAVEVCRRLGRRGMLMTKYPEQLPASLPAGVRCFGFVPFSLLLPRVAALVHHGGIGTCAEGLAAGIPHVVMPMAYDQLDNGLRLERLGVGSVVPRRKFTATRVAAALEKLLDSTAVHDRCAQYAARCNGAASLASACTAIERLLQPPGQRQSPTAPPAMHSPTSTASLP